MSEISAADVKALRDRTGAGMMACKKALVEAQGDVDKAVELLRARGEAQAAKRAGDDATEGTVQSYIHGGGRIGVLVEINCETDFVARNDAFVAFAKELALHVAAKPEMLAVSEDEVPEEDRARELRIATEQAADRPENVRERIVAGKLDKWLDEVVLMRQEHVKHEGETIEQLRAKLSTAMGENVVVRRVARFAVGD